MNLRQFEIQENVRKWCIETLEKDQENRSPEEQRNLLGYFEMAAKKQWKDVLNVFLTANPFPLSEMDVLQFCHNEIGKKENKNKEILKKIYQLAQENNWEIVQANLESNKIVDKHYMTVGTDLPKKYQPKTRPRS